MEIVWIKKIHSSKEHFITRVGYKVWWRPWKVFTSVCITKMSVTMDGKPWVNSSYYLINGKNLPVPMWKVLQCFIESELDYISNLSSSEKYS